MYELLQRIRLFSGLDEAALLAVHKRIQPVAFDAGDILCREGELGDRMFIIDGGDVDVLLRMLTTVLPSR